MTTNRNHSRFPCELMNKQFNDIIASQVKPLTPEQTRKAAKSIKNGPAKRPSECKEVLG